MEAQPPIILFDGLCNLCNSSVQFIIKHDDKALFKFASLQSDIGQALLKQYGLAAQNINSIILIQQGAAYYKSTAALKVAMQLNGLVKLLYIGIIIPAFIRNTVYDVIAKNRYKWFGKKDSCMLPTPHLKNRFLS